jgi:hypothetical protein
MARYTETRSLVRKAAQNILNAGQTPTANLVRAILGTGSLSTIVDELRRWRKDSELPSVSITPGGVPTEVAPAVQSALKAIALVEAQSLLVSVQHSLAEQRQLTLALEARLVARDAKDARLEQVLRETVAALSAAQAGHTQSHAGVADSLERMCSRFDGVQRHMLLQINEARENASAWKDRHIASKRDFAVWRDTLQAQVLQLTERLAWAQGNAGQPRASAAKVSKEAFEAAAKSGETREGRLVEKGAPTLELSTYPGHPRAVFGWDEQSE